MLVYVLACLDCEIRPISWVTQMLSNRGLIKSIPLLFFLMLSTKAVAITPQQIVEKGTEYICTNNAWFSSDFADVVKMYSYDDYIMVFNPEIGLSGITKPGGLSSFLLGDGFSASNAFSQMPRKVKGYSSPRSCKLGPNTNLDFSSLVERCGELASLAYGYQWEITFRKNAYLSIRSDFTETETFECVQTQP